MDFENLDEIKDAVEKNGDVLSVKVEALRLAYGAGKMGKHVAANISDDLAGLGINHWPDPLPIYSHEWVRLYKLGSPIAKILEAAMTIGEDEDELLREAATSEDAIVIKRIRELVCN